MFGLIFRLRNWALGFFYCLFIRPIFFLTDPELVHRIFIVLGQILDSNPATRFLVGLFFNFWPDACLHQKILGIHFSNPIGLAAGFDSDAKVVGLTSAFGFGFTEIGSITGEPCAGNSRPRLRWLKKSRALLVNYGLKNVGCERLRAGLTGRMFGLPLGVNLVATNHPNNTVETLIADYLKTFRVVRDIGDYFVVNINYPNAYCGQPFHKPENLELLLKEINKLAIVKPIFLKLSPDLNFSVVDQLVEVAAFYHVKGLVISGLSKKFRNEKILDQGFPAFGGVSGWPLSDSSDRLIRFVYRRAGGRFVIIGSGGVFSAEDAYRKIRAGASLIQLATGLFYEGPQLASSINVGLSRLLKRDGFTNVDQAVGVDSGL